MNHSSDRAEKYILRFESPGQRDELKRLAASENRTLNGQLLHLIKLGLRAAQPKQESPQ